MISKDFNSVKPYVYWLKNKSTGIKYIGLRYRNVKLNLTPNEDIGIKYFSSGKFKKEFKKEPHGFQIKIIATFDTIDDAIKYELNETKKVYRNKRYANLSSFPAVLLTDEVRLKISQANKGRVVPIELRKILSDANKGKKHSEERKEKISKGNIGKKRSEKSKKKCLLLNPIEAKIMQINF